LGTAICNSVNTLPENASHTRQRSHAQERQFMKKTVPTRPITGPLRQRINKLAHKHGLDAETRLRAALLQKIQAERDAGADSLLGEVHTMAEFYAATTTPEQARAWADLVAGFEALEGQGRIASLQAFIL